jgi:integrase
LSTRLREALTDRCPDVFGEDVLVFPSAAGTPIEYQNFRSRVFNRVVRRAFGPGRRVTPHMLRHTFASLHLARGTNLKWVQEMGGWASAKMLLDVYGHFMPTESAGYADAITASNGTQTAPPPSTRQRRPKRAAASSRNQRRKMEPTIRFERTTCSLRVSCSTS